MRTLLLALAVMGLVACATETAYQPATEANGSFGYHEQNVEGNRVRISFRGNDLTGRETVETYLLYRAAELTLERGFDYFVVADRSTDSHSRLQNVDPFGHSRFDYLFFSPRHGWGPWYDPFWDDPVQYREVTRYEAAAEIALYHGRKPPSDANAFDAREVQANLQGRITRPPARSDRGPRGPLEVSSAGLARRPHP